MKIFNKKARRDYSILETFEAGVVLSGSEVKAIRHGKADISRAYVKLVKKELFLVNAMIDTDGVLPSDQSRKLLMHKREISDIIAEIKGSRLTLVPIKMYNMGSKIKLEIALARSKKKFQKRSESKKKAIKKQMDKDMKE